MNRSAAPLARGAWLHDDLLVTSDSFGVVCSKFNVADCTYDCADATTRANRIVCNIRGVVPHEEGALLISNECAWWIECREWAYAQDKDEFFKEANFKLKQVGRRSDENPAGFQGSTHPRPGLVHSDAAVALSLPSGMLLVGRSAQFVCENESGDWAIETFFDARSNLVAAAQSDSGAVTLASATGDMYQWTQPGARGPDASCRCEQWMKTKVRGVAAVDGGVVVSDAGGLFLWDVRDPAKHSAKQWFNLKNVANYVKGPDDTVLYACAGPNDTVAAVTPGGRVLVYDPRGEMYIKELPADGRIINELTFDGTHLLVATDKDGWRIKDSPEEITTRPCYAIRSHAQPTLRTSYMLQLDPPASYLGNNGDPAAGFYYVVV